MMPTALDAAILRTLIYADVFDFPMTTTEIHRYLIEYKATLPTVQNALQHPSAWLAARITAGKLNDDCLYALPERAAQLFARRQQRDAASTELWPKALRYGAWLGRLPFVRMVAMTGALSVRNAPDAADDLDYIVVVEDGRVWLTRLFAVMLVRLVRIGGPEICPNYVLAASSLEQDDADLFMAHEVTQMVPIVGHAVYDRMRDANAWSAHYLPNAADTGFPERDHQPRGISQVAQRVAEWVLGGAIGNRLERWEMHRKLRKFAPQTSTNVEMALDASRVKGHTMNYGHHTLARYEEGLRAAGLIDIAQGYGAEAAD
jgi:hypothetical protein